MEDTRNVKPWEELSEEERQEIRESWKVKLPEKFDVFCDGCLVLDEFNDFHFPGNVYLNRGDFISCNIIVDGDFYVDGSVDAYDIDVGGDFTVAGYVDAVVINVMGDFTTHDYVQCKCINVTGNFIAGSNVAISSTDSPDYINVGGNFTILGDLNSKDIYVYGDFTFDGSNIDCHNMNVYGAFCVVSGIWLDTNGYPIHIGMPITSENE